MADGSDDDSLPEVLEGSDLVLRIWRSTDAAALTDALAVSDREFRSWLPGVMNDTRDIGAFQREVRDLFDANNAFVYAITHAGDVVGQCSLNREPDRQGVVGYWVRSDRTGRGVATTALELLTAAALAAGYQRLELRCDEGNGASAAVARKAGYSHTDTVDVEGQRTPAQTGREMIWECRA
jgi:ribosomal-protein-serine acetyltransferase